MPYKFDTDKLCVGKENDKRIKLNVEQKEDIVKEYATGLFSQRQLAAKYSVSRRLIVFVLYPDRMKKHDSKKYYSKEKQREYIKVHRHYKKELNEKGLLKSSQTNE